MAAKRRVGANRRITFRVTNLTLKSGQLHALGERGSVRNRGRACWDKCNRSAIPDASGKHGCFNSSITFSRRVERIASERSGAFGMSGSWQNSLLYAACPGPTTSYTQAKRLKVSATYNWPWRTTIPFGNFIPSSIRYNCAESHVFSSKCEILRGAQNDTHGGRAQEDNLKVFFCSL